MGRLLKGAAALLGVLTAAEAGGTAYFYRRTMMRYNAKTERTMKMSGVDWESYFPIMHERHDWMMEQPHEDVWITSHDGLKLHGTYFEGDGGDKAVICFHGYTSQGINDYGSLSYYYLNHGFRMLLIDERAHGESEGTYIGFGTMDRLDGMEWIKWLVGKMGDDAQILLHGNSMGSYGMYDERLEAAASGERNRFRLRLHISQGCVYSCAPQYVSSAGIPDDPDRG